MAHYLMRPFVAKTLGPGCVASAKISSKEALPLVVLPDHVDQIHSPANPFVKHCVKLRQSASYRSSSNSVLVVGQIPLSEVCDGSAATQDLDVLFLTEDGAEKQRSSALGALARRVVRVSAAVMDKLVGVETADSITAAGLLRIPVVDFRSPRTGSPEPRDWCPAATRILVLDGVQDPGNLGTLLRTAAAFAWDAVFLLPGCCDPMNDKALRASRGAAFRLNIAAGDWIHLDERLAVQNIPCFSGEPDPSLTPPSPKPDNKSPVGNRERKRLEASPPPPPVSHEGGVGVSGEDGGIGGGVDMKEIGSLERLCLVLGSEGQGLSEGSRSRCRAVTIPMPGKMESLNVAVAGSILMYLLKPPLGL